MRAYLEHRKGMLLRWLFNVFAGRQKASAGEVGFTIRVLGTIKRALGEH